MSECPFCLTGGIDIEPYEFLCRECRDKIAEWKAKAELLDRFFQRRPFYMDAIVKAKLKEIEGS